MLFYFYFTIKNVFLEKHSHTQKGREQSQGDLSSNKHWDANDYYAHLKLLFTAKYSVPIFFNILSFKIQQYKKSTGGPLPAEKSQTP